MHTTFDAKTLADDLCEIQRIYARFFATLDETKWDKPAKGGHKEWYVAPSPNAPASGEGIVEHPGLVNQHLPARLGALVAVLLGLWMLKDFFLPDSGWRVHGPVWMGAAVRRVAKRATVPALVGGGVLIGLCTVPCSGAVYLGVLSLLALQPSAMVGYGYLVLYNVVFMLPLVVILVAATARPTLTEAQQARVEEAAAAMVVMPKSGTTVWASGPWSWAPWFLGSPC